MKAARSTGARRSAGFSSPNGGARAQTPAVGHFEVPQPIVGMRRQEARRPSRLDNVQQLLLVLLARQLHDAVQRKRPAVPAAAILAWPDEHFALVATHV